MKIYFTASILQRDKLGHIYQRIVDYLLANGHQAQYKHILETEIDQIKSQQQEEFNEYYSQFLKRVAQCDVAIVEASFPSTLNIGHEITKLLERGKPTIVLYREGQSSLFLHGLNSDKLLLMEYNDDNLEEVIEDSIEYAKEAADTRFNFFISPRHISYLDWVAKTKKIPRSVYLRELIDKDKLNNDEFKTDAGM
jgi:hypothetical protein